MKKTIKFMFLGLFALIFSVATPSLAYNSNSLTASDSGSGNIYVSINNFVPQASVTVNYWPRGSSAQATVTGSNFMTDYNGNFSTTIMVGGDTYGAQVSATVGGQATNTVTIGNQNNNNYGNISLSPSSLNLNYGQSSTVYISNNGYDYNYGYGYNYNNNNNNFYISNNSNSNVATASISGTSIYVYGNNSGNTTITVCQSGYSSSCAYLYVTVSGGSGNYGNISLSPSSLNLNYGQSSTVYISSSNYYSGTYYISTNSNSSVANASISGNSLYVNANNSGNTTITVCQSGYSSSCAYLYVTVGGGSSVGGITFSNTNPNLSTGQSMSVNVSVPYIYSGSYYVSQNTNSNAVSASISGSTLNLYGQNSGNSTITICQNSSPSSCGNLYVTVSGGSGNYGNISLSPSSLNLNYGQSSTVYVSNNNYYSGSYYISNNSNSNVATASISGTSIYVYGNNSGNTTITVCQSGYSSSCAYLYVTVNGGSGYGNINLSPSSLNLNYGQSSTVYVSNNNYSYNYYISNNSNSNVATVSLSGNNLYVYGNNNGSTTITVCQSGYSSNCGYLYVTVGGGSGYGGSLNFTSTSLPQPVVGQYYSVQLLAYGGSSPYTFSLTSGTLPQGLNINSTGQIFGTPQSSQSSSFTLRVNDAFGRTASANFSLSPGGSVQGTSIYNNGTLISENGTVYIVYKNTKTGFANVSAFTGLGFKFGQVMYVSGSGLVDSGFIVTTSRASHPWGSWIKSGNTVYFVHEQGVIPVPDWNTFLNNGGSSDLVVFANAFDFQRPILSVMSQNDSRLR
jgi:hypothetical protein